MFGGLVAKCFPKAPANSKPEPERTPQKVEPYLEAKEDGYWHGMWYGDTFYMVNDDGIWRMLPEGGWGKCDTFPSSTQ